MYRTQPNEVVSSSDELAQCLKILEGLGANNKGAGPVILLDGVLPSTHNILGQIAIGLAARSELGVDMAYLTRSRGDHFSHKLFAAVGATPIRLPPPPKGPARFRTIASALARTPAARLGNLKGVSYKGIQVGDLVYDAVIRQTPSVYTLAHTQTLTIARALYQACRLADFFDNLFREQSIDMLALSHRVYTTFGVPARMALRHGVPVLSKKRAHIRRLESLEEHRESDYRWSDEKLERMQKPPFEMLAHTYTSERFAGTAAGHDVEYAYAAKRWYNSEHLQQTLGLRKDKPVAAIMPHAFSDAPHAEAWAIFRDYYEWFLRTLEITVPLDHIQWLVKPHPSSRLYGEEGVVEELVGQYGHVHLVPDDIKTSSVLTLCDSVVTVRGTVALESVLFDIRPVLAGKAFFSDLQAVQLCRSEQEYSETLAAIAPKMTLPERDKQQASALLFYQHQSYHHTEPVIGVERPPGLAAERVAAHELENLRAFTEAIDSSDAYWKQPYVAKVRKFMANGWDELSILELGDDSG